MGILKIKVGNILDYVKEVDAIVNSNNEHMISGGGVCGVIYKNAGKHALENYCKNNFKNKMSTNETRITPGFNLGKDIIHIFSPKCFEQIEPVEKLKEAYDNLFLISKQKGYKTILTVSIGTGVHGYKHDEVAPKIIHHLRALVKSSNINCIIVLPSEEIADIYRNI